MIFKSIIISNSFDPTKCWKKLVLFCFSKFFIQQNFHLLFYFRRIWNGFGTLTDVQTASELNSVARCSYCCYVRWVALIVWPRGMIWPQTCATQCHTNLELTDKCNTIKGVVVFGPSERFWHYIVINRVNLLVNLYILNWNKGYKGKILIILFTIQFSSKDLISR